MAQFIHLTSNRLGTLLRINVDHIISYFPEELPDQPGMMGSMVFSDTQKPGIYVRETAEEIDRLINPTGNRP